MTNQNEPDYFGDLSEEPDNQTAPVLQRLPVETATESARPAAKHSFGKGLLVIVILLVIGGCIYFSVTQLQKAAHPKSKPPTNTAAPLKNP